MKYKFHASDSSGNLKSPAKTSKIKNSPRKKVTRDRNVVRTDNFEEIKESSIQEDHGGLEEEQNSEVAGQNHSEEISEVGFTQNNSSSKTPTSMKSIFNIEDLSPDDEIYTLQCPQHYNMQDLCSRKLRFHQLTTSLTSKGEVFQLQLLNSGKKFITLAVPKNASAGSLIKLPFKGHIILRKTVSNFTVDLTDDDNNEECVKDPVKFPNDLKVRHPLLGVDWEDHVDIAEAVFNIYRTTGKKIKKRKRKTSDIDNFEMITIKEENSESEITTPKKKKKRLN